MKYNWQQSDWPNFRYDLSKIQDLLFECTTQMSLHAGSLIGSSEDIKLESLVHFMVAEAIKSSKIEGEDINRDEVVSSIKNQLGLNKKPKEIKDLQAEGISKVMIDAYKTFPKPLTKKKLNTWHEMLFLNQPSILKINIGQYRSHDEPMQIISGPIGRSKIHFQAPPSKLVNKEMQGFIEWFNETAPGGKRAIKIAPIRAAIAHLYFESIHPYEDGNGRIGRAIAEKALAQCMNRPVLLSLSQEIEAHRKLYYSAIETAQKSNEITEWLEYFTTVILKSAQQAEKQVAFIIQKSKFFECCKHIINERQKKVINKMLQEGYSGFEGGINTRKYKSMTKCSQATATRDLADLLEKNITKLRTGGGRSTSYDLNFNPRTLVD